MQIITNGFRLRRSPMPGCRRATTLVLLACPAWVVPSVRAGGGALPDNDIMMKALVEEIHRAKDVQLEDLPKPYFIQYNVQDRLTFQMQASYGGIVRDNESRFRFGTSRVRVGSPALDNTNIGRGFGGRAILPIDDEITALRQSIWWMTDADYKQAVETLTRKKAYLEQKTVEDRPDDFSPAPATQAIEPAAEIAFDERQWADHVQRLSERFEKYPKIQDADVTFFAGAANNWVVNSEGTRVRTGDHGVLVRIEAEIQAADGMRLRDEIAYLGLYVHELPPIEQMIDDIDKMCAKLIALSDAPVLEQYTGPVWFEPYAAGQVFRSLLADGLCARPLPLGAGGRGDDSLEKKIGWRILPRSFHVHDDPTEPRFEGQILAGHYTYDDEGVPPKRVSLVQQGVLKTLVAGRAPTKKIKGTTGHARSGGFGDAQANIGCLYIRDEDGLARDELKEELLEAARDEGLDYALRIEKLDSAASGALGNPVYAYKVYAEDGREELVRGIEFLPVQVRALRRLLAAGKDREVFNVTGGIGQSVIAPGIIFEELELTRIEREFDKRPILASPFQREAAK